MSMKKNKRRTLLFIGLVVILLSGMWWSYYYAEKRNRYCLEVIKLDKDQGYGYTIKQGKQTVIYQPFVPVLSQRKPFNTPDEAGRRFKEFGNKEMIVVFSAGKRIFEAQKH